MSMRKVAIILLLLATTAAAQATEDWCAEVQKTPDGFLALRQAPTRDSKMLAKIKPHTQLAVDTATCWTEGSRSIYNTDWVRVLGYNGIKRGFVYKRYLK